MTDALLPLILVIGFVFLAALVVTVVAALVTRKQDARGREEDIRGRR